MENSGMRVLYRKGPSLFVPMATPRPQDTLRTKPYSVFAQESIFLRFYCSMVCPCCKEGLEQTSAISAALIGRGAIFSVFLHSVFEMQFVFPISLRPAKSISFPAVGQSADSIDKIHEVHLPSLIFGAQRLVKTDIWSQKHRQGEFYRRLRRILLSVCRKDGRFP